MNDNGGIRFDTTKVRGFAEYMFDLWDKKYRDRAQTISMQLAGGEGGGSDGRAHAADSGGSMGSSGVQYEGLEIGKSEVENARYASETLDDFMKAWVSMANGGAFVAEEYTGQDGESADELEKDF